MNELGDCLKLWGLGLGWNFGCQNGMPWEWEDHVVKAMRLARVNNNQTWSGWRTYWVFQIPQGGRVGRTSRVVPLLYLLISFVVSRPKVQFKGTSTKASWSTLKKVGLLIFSFNFPFPFEAIFRLPPSTCVHAKLVIVSMKEGSILSLKGISRVGVLSFK